MVAEGVLVAVRVKVGVLVFVGVGVRVTVGVKLETTKRVPVRVGVKVGCKRPGVPGVADISEFWVGVQVRGKVKSVAVPVGVICVGSKVIEGGKVGGLNGLIGEYGLLNIARKRTTKTSIPITARMERTSQIEVFMLSTRPKIFYLDQWITWTVNQPVVRISPIHINHFCQYILDSTAVKTKSKIKQGNQARAIILAPFGLS